MVSRLHACGGKVAVVRYQVAILHAQGAAFICVQHMHVWQSARCRLGRGIGRSREGRESICVPANMCRCRRCDVHVAHPLHVEYERSRACAVGARVELS